MKKLNKLEINSEKLMKNEELLTLRGGYGNVHCGDPCKLESEGTSDCSSASGCPKCMEPIGLPDAGYQCFSSQ